MGDNNFEVTSRVVNFINEDHTVLYLKGNTLDAVPLSEASWFERVQAWFGYGPLSLSNISNFIQEHNIAKRHPELTQAFYTKLVEKCEHFNQKHLIKKINNAFFNNLKEYCKIQSADSSSTDPRHKPEDVLDFAYSNATLGTAYVIDMNPTSTKKETWNSTFQQIQKDYENSLKSQKFSSLDEASNWFKSQMDPLIRLSAEFDFSWVQKVEIKGEAFLLTCHKGSPSIFIKHLDGTIDRTKKQETQNSYFVENAISRADVIVGVTKGLGDYTTQNTMIEALQQVEKDPSLPFQRLIKTLNPNSTDSPVMSASGKPVTKGLSEGGDDLALFVLR